MSTLDLLCRESLDTLISSMQRGTCNGGSVEEEEFHCENVLHRACLAL